MAPMTVVWDRAANRVAPYRRSRCRPRARGGFPSFAARRFSGSKECLRAIRMAHSGVPAARWREGRHHPAVHGLAKTFMMSAPLEPLGKVRTKIVATVGPASREPAVLRQLVEAGVDIFRLNFSHGTHDEHSASLAAIRRIGDE